MLDDYRQKVLKYADRIKQLVIADDIQEEYRKIYILDAADKLTQHTLKGVNYGEAENDNLGRGDKDACTCGEEKEKEEGSETA